MKYIEYMQGASKVRSSTFFYFLSYKQMNQFLKNFAEIKYILTIS